GAMGGVLAPFGDAALAPGASFPFTTTIDSPVVGVGGATVSVAGAGDRVAVAWADRRACTGCSGREIFLVLVDASGARTSGEVQVSAPSDTPKGFPRVVFDGE